MPKPSTANIKLQRPGKNSAIKKNGKERRLKLTGVNAISDDMRQWWDKPEDQIAGCIASLVHRIDRNNVEYRERFMRFARLYGNYEALGFANLTSTNTFQNTNNLPVYNIIQSAVDVVNSKICRDNPAPYFITSGANYFDKLKAEKMTQFTQGCFQQMDLYEKANNKVFRDASVYGLGALHFFYNQQKKRLDCEWVFIDELKIDLYDAQKGEPRSIHKCRMINKELLMSMFPDKQTEINETTTGHPTLFRSNETVIDYVVYTESWHLASGDHKGRHVISLTDKVLLDEEWDHDWFPIVFFQYYQKPVGLYGRGITESIISGQVEINKILFFIQQCQELQATPLIVTDGDSQISPITLLNNRIARQVKIKSGTMAPQFISPSSTGSEIYQHLKDWMSWCYAEVGISQTAVSGQKQAGVNSAVAMRTMVDIESSRFIQVSKNWERFFVRCAETCVKLGKIVYRKDNKFSVKYVDKKSKIIKEIAWDKINLPEDAFVIKCDTVSSFPQSAAGRIQTITDYISNQYISKERGMEMLNLDPDLEDEVKLQTSTLRLTEKLLADMVEDNKYQHPEPYLNLKLSLSICQSWYNQLKIDECPESRLKLVRQFISEIITLLTGKDPISQMLQMALQPTPTVPIAPRTGLSPN